VGIAGNRQTAAGFLLFSGATSAQDEPTPRNPHPNRFVWQWVKFEARAFCMGEFASRELFAATAAGKI